MICHFTFILLFFLILFYSFILLCIVQGILQVYRFSLSKSTRQMFLQMLLACFVRTMSDNNSLSELGPHTALAAVFKDGAVSTLPQVGAATGAHVEAGPVIWVGICAIRLVFAEATSRNRDGGLGGRSVGGATGLGSGRFGCFGRNWFCSSNNRFFGCGCWRWWSVCER